MHDSRNMTYTFAHSTSQNSRLDTSLRRSGEAPVTPAMAPAIGASQIGASSPTNWQSSSSSSLGWSLSPFGTPSSNARGLPLILLSFSRPLRLLRPLGVATVIDPTS